MGGKCTECQKVVTPATQSEFEFHHVDPSTKEYNMAWLLRRAGKDKILRELEKCVLMCASCHTEIHRGNNGN